MTVEIVYRWDDGREEVRYRRPHGSDDAKKLMMEVEILADRARLGRYESPYFYRFVEEAAT